MRRNKSINLSRSINSSKSLQCTFVRCNNVLNEQSRETLIARLNEIKTYFRDHILYTFTLLKFSSLTFILISPILKVCNMRHLHAQHSFGNFATVPKLPNTTTGNETQTEFFCPASLSLSYYFSSQEISLEKLLFYVLALPNRPSSPVQQVSLTRMCGGT